MPPQLPGQRRYAPAEKMEAVVCAKELGRAKASERLGIPARTLERWEQAAAAEYETLVKESTTLAIPDGPAGHLTYRERQPLLANRFGHLAASILEGVPALLAAGKLQGVQQSVTSAAICVDKAQLLSGNVTSRTEHGSTPQELDARLLELAATLKAQRDNLREGRAVEAASEARE